MLRESFVAQEKTFRLSAENVSVQTKQRHVDLYKSHVQKFNEASARLDGVDTGLDSPYDSSFGSLKCQEIRHLNSVWLHELYFSNSFDSDSEIKTNSLAFMRLQRDWGDFLRWQEDFIACAMSSVDGWAITGHHGFLQGYYNFFVDADCCNVPLGVVPLIVLDMHEHSYIPDFGDKKSYILDSMAHFDWNVIEDRFSRAEMAR